jgi:hypothetical protein
VLEVRRDGRRPAPVLHVGRPAGAGVRRAVPSGEDLDAALRVDVVARMLQDCGCHHPAVWLARPGSLGWHDLDARWLPAALAAYAEAGATPTFVVVTRQGWWEPLTGTGRVWKRLRDRAGRGAPVG